MRWIDFTNTEVASSETARHINRSILLHLIRRRQPVSRADLARITGLQRSTVSLITRQLIGEKWVVNGPFGRLPRGRHPIFLRLNDRVAILVVDLRPCDTTIAIADVNGRILAQDRMQTPENPADGVQGLGERLRRLIELNPELIFAGVGVSVPGRVDPVTQRVIFAPNLKWPEFDIKGPLEQATGMRVELENAATACVLAEVWFGDPDGRDMVVITVSEGIGAGLFAGGQAVRGLSGMAGEFGHVQFDPEGPECGCGRHGCWEVYASTRAAMRYYSESRAVASGPTFQDLLRLAEAGDSLAIKALEKMARAIGRGLRMIVAALSPAEIVIVGELTRQWDRFEPVLAEEIAAATLAGKPAEVRPAAVDSSLARLRGALAVALHSQFAPSGRPPETAMSADRDGISAVLGNVIPVEPREVLTPAI